ncbi:helix-turn-helix domain-containing protein [Collinsella ihumii]|uniref:helix-turn-helix domain-containing protein n=1 Tax=Collinsella ihumii TaxID=1720204 RepID=UPI00082B2518|nr:helix-turn-helix domain-containing protein [Collinsella ihumii]
MYPKETRELALEALRLGFSVREAAELAGCSRRSVRTWRAKVAGPRPRKAPVYLPLERKMELVARYEAGERAADLADIRTGIRAELPGRGVGDRASGES